MLKNFYLKTHIECARSIHLSLLVLPLPSLVIVYKAFKRYHLHYGDVIYDQTYKESCHQKLESIQC